MKASSRTPRRWFILKQGDDGTYLFQGWNCRASAKYRDMILDIGTEEVAYVEMLATMIARLLESSPVEVREDAAKDSLLVR